MQKDARPLVLYLHLLFNTIDLNCLIKYHRPTISDLRLILTTLTLLPWADLLLYQLLLLIPNLGNGPFSPINDVKIEALQVVFPTRIHQMI